MPFDLDTKIDVSSAPVITLAGRELFVPPLALRQSRIVVPLLIRLMPAMAALEEHPDAFGEVEWDDLTRLVHAALTRAYPSLTLDQVLDLPASLAELAGSVAVITRQTGMFKAADDSAGESNGETASPSPAPPSNSIA